MSITFEINQVIIDIWIYCLTILCFIQNCVYHCLKHMFLISVALLLGFISDNRLLPTLLSFWIILVILALFISMHILRWDYLFPHTNREEMRERFKTLLSFSFVLPWLLSSINKKQIYFQCLLSTYEHNKTCLCLLSSFQSDLISQVKICLFLIKFISIYSHTILF